MKKAKNIQTSSRHSWGRLTASFIKSAPLSKTFYTCNILLKSALQDERHWGWIRPLRPQEEQGQEVGHDGGPVSSLARPRDLYQKASLLTSCNFLSGFTINVKKAPSKHLHVTVGHQETYSSKEPCQNIFTRLLPRLNVSHVLATSVSLLCKPKKTSMIACVF